MEIKRCAWCGDDPLYQHYHDTDWGVPVHDDQLLFEFLLLETFQAGLSWITILRKRENFRRSFDGFNVATIANYTEAKKEELRQDAGIIRNRLKIKSAVNNAQHFLRIQRTHGSFDNYIWSFVDHQPIMNTWRSMSEVPASTPLSDHISKSLKKEGFSFVGTTVIYAFMQAIGMVNDHVVDCFRYNELTKT